MILVVECSSEARDGAPFTRAGGLTWSRSDGQHPPEENQGEKTPHDQEDDVQEALDEEEVGGAGLRSRSEEQLRGRRSRQEGDVPVAGDTGVRTVHSLYTTHSCIVTTIKYRGRLFIEEVLGNTVLDCDSNISTPWNSEDSEGCGIQIYGAALEGSSCLT